MDDCLSPPWVLSFPKAEHSGFQKETKEIREETKLTGDSKLLTNVWKERWATHNVIYGTVIVCICWGICLQRADEELFSTNTNMLQWVLLNPMTWMKLCVCEYIFFAKWTRTVKVEKLEKLSISDYYQRSISTVYKKQKQKSQWML